jgi:hypothetical protein
VSDPAAFAEARLAEDEAIAQRNIDAGLLDDDEKTGPGYPDYQTYRDDDTEAADKYLMCFRPRRMLREVEAGRLILAAHVPDHHEPDAYGVRICAVCVSDKSGGYAENWVMDLWPCLPVRAVLLSWADHEDYDPEWRP